ncbi:MAG: lipase maturation factor family protein [Deltaproteobacteria bacterium]|nr:lipase maturation factor family protein [Deltaproteobacteria bacterium]
MDEDVRVPTPWESLASWLGPPRSYQLTRTLIFRLLGFVYVFAFLGIILQGPALLGSHGLTPIGAYVDRMHAAGVTFWDVPTVFMFGASDSAIATWAWIGFVISLAVACGYANMPMLLVLWAIYGSYERVGQLWFSFGWEIQILETTLIAAVIAHPWDPRPLAARPPPVTGIVLMRWLVFRIMLGAGLIKLRGDSCWTHLTCLDFHFETQPLPNPLSPLFHHAPHWFHAFGVVYNHVVEVVAPFFVFGPRRLRLIAGSLMFAFQGILVMSGNLAFLNWLTLVPILACFDDDFLLRLAPRRVRTWLQSRMAPATPRPGKELVWAIPIALAAILIWQPLFGWLQATGEVIVACVALGGVMVLRGDRHQRLVGIFAALVIAKSWPVVANLASHHQAMNTEFDRLATVNTYGAFGSVGDVRHELVIEGTLDADPERATWQAYELPCKPTALDRRPCVLGPYHRRLDWLIWFSAMYDQPEDPWIIHFVWKLLDGDTTIRQLLGVDPFAGKPPKWVRIRRFVYHLAPVGAPTWWTRDSEELWLPPVSKDTDALRDALSQYNWPSPSSHD